MTPTTPATELCHAASHRCCVPDLALELIDVTKRFGAFTAVNGLSFTLPRGQILGYLGPNGAGKTTSIRMMLGILQPDQGVVHVLGGAATVPARPHRLSAGGARSLQTHACRAIPSPISEASRACRRNWRSKKGARAARRAWPRKIRAHPHRRPVERHGAEGSADFRHRARSGFHHPGRTVLRSRPGQPGRDRTDHSRARAGRHDGPVLHPHHAARRASGGQAHRAVARAQAVRRQSR